MQLSTPVTIEPLSRPFGYESQILTIGSCFADSIAGKLKDAFFRIKANPFGTQYNPMSIAQCIDILSMEDTEKQRATMLNSLFESGGLWHSWLTHGSFSSTQKQAVEEAIIDALQKGSKAVKESEVVIITFGSAYIYEFEGRVVSNCHKVPSRFFERRRLSIEEIVDTYQEMFSQPMWQSKTVILTVSPIRHLKDGLHENQLSKATLLLATAQLVESFQNVHYFPSYEVMLDELRDYRFYDNDLLHPSSLAVELIWEKFCKYAFSQETQAQVEKYLQLSRDLSHRPLHPDTPEAQQFQRRLQERLQEAKKNLR